MRTTLLTGTVALLLNVGCVGTDDEGGTFGTTAQPIFGGQAATACQWPTTVLLSGCTGTLVHPQIVTTAAHCGTNHKTAIFGESRTAPARRVNIEYCRVFPNHRNTEDDRAFCKLATPVTDVPIAPILMGCEVDILKPGQKVVVAGFGDNDDNGDGFGTKRWVETTVRAAPDGNGVRIGGMGQAPCFGDSGGPAFVQLADGSWRAFGIDSVGTGASCGAGDRMSLIHKAAPWIEQQSGIDITPCHDANGTWNPGPNCKSFSLAPLAAGRTWATGCAEPTLSPPAATCGAGIVGPVDAGPPGDTGGQPPDAGADQNGPPINDAGADRSVDQMIADVRPETGPPSDGGGVGETIPRPMFDAPPAPIDAATDTVAPPAMHAGDAGCGCGLGTRGQAPAKSPGSLLGVGLAVWLLSATRRPRRPSGR